MKIGFKIFAFSWLGLSTLIGIKSFLDTPKQVKKDNDFVNLKIKPAVDFIQKFKSDSTRLPTNEEFYIWERTRNDEIEYIRSCNDLPNKYKDECEKIDWTKALYDCGLARRMA
jgi:hypothetical protein